MQEIFLEDFGVSVIATKEAIQKTMITQLTFEQTSEYLAEPELYP